MVCLCPSCIYFASSRTLKGANWIRINWLPIQSSGAHSRPKPPLNQSHPRCKQATMVRMSHGSRPVRSGSNQGPLGRSKGAKGSNQGVPPAPGHSTILGTSRCSSGSAFHTFGRGDTERSGSKNLDRWRHGTEKENNLKKFKSCLLHSRSLM